MYTLVRKDRLSMYSMTKRLGTELDGGEGKVLRIVHEEWVVAHERNDSSLVLEGLPLPLWGTSTLIE